MDRRDVAQLVRNMYNGKVVGGSGVPELYAVQSCVDVSPGLLQQQQSTPAAPSSSEASASAAAAAEEREREEGGGEAGAPQLPPATLGQSAGDVGKSRAGAGGAFGLVLAVELLRDIDDGSDDEEAVSGSVGGGSDGMGRNEGNKDRQAAPEPVAVVEPRELRKRPSSTTSDEPAGGMYACPLCLTVLWCCSLSSISLSDAFPSPFSGVSSMSQSAK